MSEKINREIGGEMIEEEVDLRQLGGESKEGSEKTREYGSKIGYILVIILVATLFYGIGRVGKLEGQKPDIYIEDSESHNILNDMSSSGEGIVNGVSSGEILKETELVGSKNGTKYHYSWCPGAKQIKQENKIFFKSIEEAKNHGYNPAQNCPGLN